MNTTPEELQKAKKLIAKVNGAKGGNKKWEKITPEGREIALNKLQEGKKKYIEQKKDPSY